MPILQIKLGSLGPDRGVLETMGSESQLGFAAHSKTCIATTKLLSET